MELLQRLKSQSESRPKKELRQFLEEYRHLFEQPGVSDSEFWAMVDAVGLKGVRA